MKDHRNSNNTEYFPNLIEEWNKIHDYIACQSS